MLKKFLNFICFWRENEKIKTRSDISSKIAVEEQATPVISHKIVNDLEKKDSVEAILDLQSKIKLEDLLPYLHGQLESHLVKRLSNALVPDKDTNNLRLLTLADYLNNENSFRSLLTNPNIGRITCSALDRFIKDLVSNRISGLTLNDVINQNKLVGDKLFEQVNSTHTIKELFSEILNEKEFFVLINRSERNRTLEDVGKELQVTRERVRQIESYSIDKINLRYKSALESFAAKLDELLDDSYGHITIQDCTKTLKINKSDLYMLLFASGRFLKQKLYVKDEIIYREANRDNFSGWNAEIDNNLFSMKWPVNIRSLQSQLEDIPHSYIEHYLSSKRGAQIKNDIIFYIEKLPRIAIVTYILRDENRSMTPDEVALKAKKIFDVDMSGHSASSILARMDNALIVARGTYALYESLQISQEIIDNIRKESYNYIYQTRSFVSSKVLYEELFREKYCKYSIMNDYVILGILQDDNRFVTKRGLMVGLVDFEHETKIKSLKEEISEIVEHNGPIKVLEVQQKLSLLRRILPVTITLMLENDERFVRCEVSTFASIKHVFKEAHEYELFKIAIQIILLNERSGVYYLKKKLERITRFSQVTINQALLQCVLRRIKNITKKHEVYNLEKTLEDLTNYNKQVSENINKGFSLEQIKENILKTNDIKNFIDYLSIDYRLQYENFSDNNQANRNEGELDSILGAFGI